jgi:iron complex outermembrane receptor protein
MNDDTELTIKYEHGTSDNDGPSAQTHTNGSGVPGFFANFSRESFDISIDEPGFNNYEWDALTATLESDVELGEGGALTAIFGWRQGTSETMGDIDAQPVWLFHAPAQTEQEQYSFEGRYFGRFWDNTDITAGLYYFSQDLAYAEQRHLVGDFLAGAVVTQSGGGIQEQSQFAVFANADVDLTDNLTVSAGARWTTETKEADIATLPLNTVVTVPAALGTICNVIAGSCAFDFSDKETWTAFSPRVGIQYAADEETMLYANWARGFRAGGYNFRNTSFIDGPGPFDQEQVDTFEGGLKTNFFDRGIFNVAAFYTQVTDMQREVNVPDPVSAVVQVIKNTADTDIYGFEMEGSYAVTDNFLILGSVGYTEGEYQSVLFDISGDGIVDATDLGLDIPRLAPWSVNIGFVHDYDLGDVGVLSSRFNYASRSEAAYTDNNLGTLNDAGIIDASTTLRLDDGNATISLYGKNLLHDVQHGNDTQLPSTLVSPFIPVGGSFAPLAKGRIVGLEFTLNYGGRSRPITPEPAPEPIPEPVDNCQNEEKVVYFDFDESTIRSDAGPVLDDAAELISECATEVVIVEGHTDTMGSERYNEGLALRRAEAVRDALVNRGVAGNMIEIESLGETQPAVDSGNQQREQANRRAVVVIRIR